MAQYDSIHTGAAIDGAITKVSNEGPWNKVQFDLTPSDTSQAEGKLVWNATDGTLNLGLPGAGGVNLQIGQEHIVRVRNDELVTIPNGAAVYINGSTGDMANVKLANASTFATGLVLGLATEDISSHGNGYVTVAGYVRNINTSGMNYGTPVWLSTISGEWTTTQPSVPNVSTFIGYVIREHADEGIMLVRPLIYIMPNGGFSDVDFGLYDGTDSTKKLAFELSGITTSTTRTISIPDKNGTLAMTSDIPTAAAGAVVFDDFVGDGTEHTFVLSQTIVNPEDIIVTIDGVIQTPTTDYTVSGTNLIFGTPPANLTVIESRLMSSSVNTYSTTETVIGTWLGSPLYRKVVSFGALPNSATKSVAHNISGLDTFVNISGWWKDTALSIWGPLPTVYPDTSINYDVELAVTATNINVTTKYNASAKDVSYVILEYTKS